MQLYLVMSKSLAMTSPVVILEIPVYTRAALLFDYAMGIVKRVSATGLAASWFALSHEPSTFSY